MNPYEDLLARLQAAPSDDERAWITLEFNLANQPQKRQTMVWAASVLHWFDRDMLEFLLDTKLSDEEFNAFLALPYVEEFPERGWNIHEKSRDLLRDRLWNSDQARYRKLSRRAAAWCRKRQSGSATWQVEACYHALLGNEKGGEDAFVKLGLAWHNRFRFNELEALLRPVISAAHAGRLVGRAVGWAFYLQAQIDIRYSRNHQARDALERALVCEAGGMTLQANCIQALGDVHVSLSELPQARTRYEEALPIYHDIGGRLGEANCIQALGDVHAKLSELPQARQRYEEALPIYRDIGARLGEANCIRAQGDVHAIISELPQGRRRYEEALSIYRDIGDRLGEANCIRALGNVHESLSELPQARWRYEKALPIYRDIGDRLGEANSIRSLGDVHFSLSEFPQARWRYEEALPICRDIGDRLGEADCIKALGDVHVSLSELPQARRRHEEALAIYRDIGDRLGEANCIKALGGVAGEEDHLDEASAYFKEATQRYRELNLPAQQADCYNSMAIHLNNVQRHDAALEAWGKAIELFPHVNYYINRAEPHMHLGDFAAAQRDLDAAAAMNPDYDYLHFNRGRLALWQGQAQDALAHIAKAVAKIPEYGEFRLWRALALALSGTEWREELQAGLARTYLVRQIREAAEAADKLEATYGAGTLEGPRAALRAALAERAAANRSA